MGDYYKFVQNYGSYGLVLNFNHMATNRLLLISIAFETCEFSVVRRESLKSGFVLGFCFDQMDARKFAIKIGGSNEEQADFMVRGCVTEDKRILLERSMTLEGWKYEKLSGDKYFGICKEAPGTLTYRSMNVNSGESVEEFELDFDWPKVVDNRRLVVGVVSSIDDVRNLDVERLCLAGRTMLFSSSTRYLLSFRH